MAAQSYNPRKTVIWMICSKCGEKKGHTCFGNKDKTCKTCRTKKKQQLNYLTDRLCKLE